MGLSFLFHFDEVIIQVGFWMSVAFIIGTSTFWPWWKTDLGWTIIFETLGLGILMFPTSMELEFGIKADTLTWQWIASLSFVFVVIVLPWRAVAIWRRQRYGPPTDPAAAVPTAEQD